MEDVSDSTPTSKLTVPVGNRDHIQGPINAPVTLLEYGDYECRACGGSYPIVKAIQQSLGESLCFAFRYFPLTNVHRHAQHAAEAAEAAGAQGHFWEMHDLLFKNQGALDDAALARYAGALRLDDHLFMAQIASDAYTARIQDDFQSGLRSGVDGTPTFFINGVRYDGAPDALLAVLTPLAQGGGR